MDKKLKRILQYILWTGVAAALLWFSFRGVNWKDFGEALRNCHWGYVVLSMVFGALALWFRAMRWRMQLLPIDPSTSRLTCFDAYNICMVVNLVVPRAGEVARSALVTKNSGRDGEGRRLATLDKVIGTVLADRLWDAVSLVLVMVLVLSVMWDRFGTYFKETFFPGLADKAGLWWVVVLVILAIGAFFFLCWKLRDRGRIWGKVWGWIRGLGDGISSCLHMKHGWLFIVYTVIIWCMYWLMSATILWSLQGIDTTGLSPEFAGAVEKLNAMGMSDALFLMFAGALSSLVPVPGGFGAFHTVVAGALSSLYGVPFGVGIVFATLSHESQVLTDIICGGCSYIHDTFFRRP
ncbi:MAG: flippase-like domain-containing protein [Bacteroidales bacterium]|jgi:hypothetical protein|nr:flippase-like domain-containing protein [Bacteroidales bacterium]